MGPTGLRSVWIWTKPRGRPRKTWMEAVKSNMKDWASHEGMPKTGRVGRRGYGGKPANPGISGNSH
jgi:hypothetical protein